MLRVGLPVVPARLHTPRLVASRRLRRADRTRAFRRALHDRRQAWRKRRHGRCVFCKLRSTPSGARWRSRSSPQLSWPSRRRSCCSCARRSSREQALPPERRRRPRLRPGRPDHVFFSGDGARRRPDARRRGDRGAGAVSCARWSCIGMHICWTRSRVRTTCRSSTAISSRLRMRCCSRAGADLVKVLDFGICARSPLSMTRRMTHTGSTMGTPAFMPPEVASGVHFDSRADLYSLGCGLAVHDGHGGNRRSRPRCRRCSPSTWSMPARADGE